MPERIERAVEVVNEACQKSALEAAVITGRYLLKHFYGGSYADYRSRRRGRSPLSEISEHPDLTVSASFLSRAIGVAHQMEELPDDIGPRLTLEQHRALLGLPPDAKVALGRKALKRGWSSRTLAKEAAALRTALSSHPRPGRRKQPPALRTLRRVERLLSDQGAWAGLERLSDMPAAERMRLREALVDLREQLDRALSALG